MARSRSARGGQDKGEGGKPAQPPKPSSSTPARRRGGGPPNPRPVQGGSRRRKDKAGTVTKAVQQRRGSRFLAEVVAELRKVSWPTRTVLLQSTGVVLLVVAIVSAYLAALDTVFDRLIDSLF
jgi:preprotein translocase subunit SecE